MDYFVFVGFFAINTQNMYYVRGKMRALMRTFPRAGARLEVTLTLPSPHPCSYRTPSSPPRKTPSFPSLPLPQGGTTTKPEPVNRTAWIVWVFYFRLHLPLSSLCLFCGRNHNSCFETGKDSRQISRSTKGSWIKYILQIPLKCGKLPCESNGRSMG